VLYARYDSVKYQWRRSCYKRIGTCSSL